MFFKQLYLLLWKNFTIRRRHLVRTIIEILWPILLFSILIAVRLTQPAERLQECHYPARALPSAGVFPWIQTMFCNLDNPCFHVPVASETPGQINEPFNSTTGLTGGLSNVLTTIEEETTIFTNPDAFVQDITILQTMINEIAREDSEIKATISSLMGDSGATKTALINIGLSNDLADTILQSKLNMYQVAQLNSNSDKKSLVCNVTELSAAITIPGTAPLTVNETSAQLCALNSSQQDAMWNELQSGVDLNKFYETEGQDLLIQAGTGSGLNTADLAIFVALRLPQLNQELQKVLAAMTDLMSSLSPDGSGNIFTSAIGYDLASRQGFADFCGHPYPKESIGQAALGGISELVFRLNDNSSSSDFCTNLITTFESNEELGFAWSVLKPVLFGKIPFSPDTNITRDIMSRANGTFGAIANLDSLTLQWIEKTGPELYDYLQNDPTVALFRTILDADLGSTGVIDISESQLTFLRAFLSNNETSNVNGTVTWKQLYNQLNVGILLVHKLLSCMNLDKFEGYPDEPALETRSLDLLENNSFWAGIVFQSPTAEDTELPKHIKYKIRQDVDDVMRTDFIEMYFWEPGPMTGPLYISYLVNGFADMQDIMEQGITKATADVYGDTAATTITLDYGRVPKLGYYLQQMPYPCYVSDKFLEYLSSMMSLLMTLAWIYSVCIIIKNIVYEKEERLKEFMKMMGLSNGVHWLAWFINSFYLMTLSSILLIVVLRAGMILPYSNPFILLIWMLSFCLATIGQCFLISCFFTKANLAAACGGIIYFMLYIPYNFAITWEDELTYGGKIGLSLFSTVAFGYGAGFVSSYEMTGKGIQFSNWDKNPVPEEQYTFVTSIIMMLVDAAIYFVLTWYVENVYPGKYGIPRPPYFMFTKSYWCGVSPTPAERDQSAFLNPAYASNGTQASLEAEPEHLPLGVSIHNLTKIYSNGNKLAVDNLTLNFYEGQITSFLGHNGAGKTTTMSILCGLFTPTRGTAYIHNHDIRTDMDFIRTSLGFCPQHNVLFRDLTVKEHLEFYAGLRGQSKSTIREDTKRMLADVNLIHKKNEVVSNLSGGMKRKLSVAVAFTGNSKTVILDEPTAGVDPYARRGIWDLLIKYRQGRTIILSTHHMDEADLLGDRIAIISQGSLKCCGSSLFLKSTYGVGYYLTLVKQKNIAKPINNEPAVLDVSPEDDAESDVASEDEGFASKAASSKSSIAGEKMSPTEKELDPTLLNKKEAENLIQDIVPSAKLYEENRGEITFILPYSALEEGKYAGLFQSLDDNNISYGLTDTSLEEIFLSVADHLDETSKPDQSCFSCFTRKRAHSTSSISPEQSPRNSNDNANRDEPIQLVKVTRKDSLTQSEEPENQSPKSAAVQLEPVQEEDEEDIEELDDSNGKGSYQITGGKLIGQQFTALLIKRWIHARRNRKGIFAQIILPSAFVLIALCLTLILPPYDGQPSLELQPWMYGDNQYTFFSNDNPNNTDSSSISDALIDSPGYGTRCVDGYNIMNYGDYLLDCIPSGVDEWKVDNETKSRSQMVDSKNLTECICSTADERVLLAECPLGAGGSETPYLKTNTTDTVYNMTERNVADWLVKTTDRFIERRYGGLSVGEKYNAWFEQSTIDNLVDLLARLNQTTPDNKELLIFLENMWRTENGQVWFDNNGFHAMPAYLNIMSNGLLRSKLPAGANPSEYAITVYNHPMNYTKQQVSQAALAQTAIDTAIAIVVVFALSFVPASFVIFLIDERITKAKHLQFISGVDRLIYWIANFVWDMINYLIPMIIVVIIFVCFQTKAYVSPQNLPCLILLMLLYGWSVTPMMYPFSFVFDVSSTAYVVLTCVNLFIGINTSIATLILDLLEGDENLQRVNDILQKVFLIFPHYCMGRGLIVMAVNQATADAYARFGINSFVDPLSWDLAGKNLAAMAITGVVFFGINLLIQYRFFIRPTVNEIPEPAFNETMEEDVINEKTRILNHQNPNDILHVENLSKVYEKFPMRKGLLAVDRMCVGVGGGECFGLLGVNGAGKTTTFKMLTGDEMATAGDAKICGMSINQNIRAVQQNSGYCPQFDALNSHLTGFEHLQLYARLRGVPPEEVDVVANWGVNKLGLKQYAHKPAGTYSGGNKRKLSAAIAFIGCPPVIFLDEPTAGMDPGARRFLWKRISEVIKVGDYNTDGHNRCIVLTSHSMEECEALCTRLAIMVNGKFQCIGTPQHLKNKYGKGYTVSVRVGGEESDLNKVLSFLLDGFPGAVLKERHHNMIVLQLPLEVVKLAEVFKLIETNKTNLHIEDYSVSQTTLDEVFVSFAKHQTDGEDQPVMIATNSQNSDNNYEMSETMKQDVIA
ncbi:phospholipid-transporting ATPase ABCA1-like isoform X1 [Styela clava]